MLQMALRRLCAKQKKARFILSLKLVPAPSSQPDFVGNVFDAYCRTMRYRKGLVSVLVHAWLKLVNGRMGSKGMERLLGCLEWALQKFNGWSGPVFVWCLKVEDGG